jgi:large subunit ribosomal protein L5
VKSALKDQLGLANVMQIPRLEKIVINMGVGKATQQPSLLEGAVRDMTAISGQKPIITKAKDSIAAFKLREGQAIGCKVTLRGDRAWEFLDRLISVAIPRMRDFRGLPREQLGRPRQLHVRPQRPDRSSRRSTTTRSTPRGGWTSRSSRRRRPTSRAVRCSTRSDSRSSGPGDQQSTMTPKKPKRRGPAFSGKKKK